MQKNRIYLRKKGDDKNRKKRISSHPPKEVGKNEKNLNKKYRFPEKNFGSETETEIGPWFRFPIPKPNFGLTLNINGLLKIQSLHQKHSFLKPK